MPPAFPAFCAVHWKDATTTDTYLFVDGQVPGIADLDGQTCDSLSALSGEVAEYLAPCTAWLRSRTAKASPVHVMKRAIYDDDTRHVLRIKLHAHVRELTIPGPAHIYVWHERLCDAVYIDAVVKDCFAAGNAYLDAASLSAVVATLDPEPVDVGNRARDRSEVKAFLTRHFADLRVPEAFEVERVDATGRHLFQCPDPYYEAVAVEGRMVANDGAYQPEPNNGRQLLVHSQRLVGRDVHIVHFTTTVDLTKAAAVKAPGFSEEGLHTGMVKRYCPQVVLDAREEAAKKAAVLDAAVIAVADDAVAGLRRKAAAQPASATVETRRISLFVSPVGAQHIDVEFLFKVLPTTEASPFLELRDHDNQLFRIHRDAIGKTVPFDRLREWCHCSKYTKPSDMTAKAPRARRALCAWLPLDDGEFCRVILYDDGSYQVFMKNRSRACYAATRSFIDAVASALALSTDMFYTLDFDSPPPFWAEYIDYEAQYTLTTKQKVRHAWICKWLSEFACPFIYMISANKAILFKYKRVEDYVHTKDADEMIRLLKDEGLQREAIVKEVRERCGLTEAAAKQAYDAPQGARGGVRGVARKGHDSRYNNSILVKLVVENDYQVKVEYKGIRDPAIIERVNALVWAACTSNPGTETMPKFNQQKRDVLDVIEAPRAQAGAQAEAEARGPVPDPVDDEDDDEEYDLVFGGSGNGNAEDDETAPVYDTTAVLKNNDAEVKKYHGFIRYNLMQFDKELFGFKGEPGKKAQGYTSKCQISDMRMPIAITAEEKTDIDRRFGHAYSKSIMAGSTVSNCNKHHYICPQIWCPISRIPVTEKDLVLDAASGKRVCPDPANPGHASAEPEPPIYLSANYWKGSEDTRYPGFLKVKHPDGLSLPCCFKLDQQKKGVQKPVCAADGAAAPAASAQAHASAAAAEDPDTKTDVEPEAAGPMNDPNQRYINRKPHAAVEAGRYGVLPKEFALYFESLQCSFKDNETCFVRRGVEQGPSSFLSCMTHLLGVPGVDTPDAMVAHIREHMSVADYISLNGGNTLKLFFDERADITDPKQASAFRAWFTRDVPHQLDYIKRFNLVSLKQELEHSDGPIQKPSVNMCREFVIYNSFVNFMQFLGSNVYKHHDIMYDLMSPRFSWLNSDHTQLVVLEYDEETGTGSVHCPRYVGVGQTLDITRPFVMILRQGTLYEPVVSVGVRDGSFGEVSSFKYASQFPLRRLVDYITKTGCKSAQDDAIKAAKEVRSVLLAGGYKIQQHVINAGFKLCGYVVQSIYVPLATPCPMTAIPPNTPVRYVHQLHRLRPVMENVKPLFLKLDQYMQRKRKASIYGSMEVVKNEDDAVGVILDPAGSRFVVPIHMTVKDEEHFKTELLNENLFIRSVLPPGLNQTLTKIRDYSALLLGVVRRILVSKPLSRRICAIKHELNPFSEAVNQAAMKELVGQVLEQLAPSMPRKPTAQEVELLNEDLYQKDLRFILAQTITGFDSGSSGDIRFDQFDVIRDTNLKTMEASMRNVFQHVRNSSEDYLLQADNFEANTKELPLRQDDASGGAVEWSRWSAASTALELKAEIEPARIHNMVCGKHHEWHKHGPIASNEELRELFRIVSELNNSSVDDDSLQEFLHNSLVNDFTENKVSLLSELALNETFGKALGVKTMEQVQHIVQRATYAYGIYELRKLAEYVGVNVVLIGRKHEKKLPDGVMIFDNESHTHLVLYATTALRFQLVFDASRKQFLFDKSELRQSLRDELQRLAPVTFQPTFNEIPSM